MVKGKFGKISKSQNIMKMIAGSLFPKMLVFRWQEIKGQYWSILGSIFPEMGINEKHFVETT